MTSLGVSPTFPSSLLIPPNPSFTSADNTPRGGILRNARRESDVSCPPSPAFGPMSIKTSSPMFKSEPDSPEMPISPIDQIPTINNTLSSPQPRIRFAPLPDPRRPRSLSAGDNGGWVSGDEESAAPATVGLNGMASEREVSAVEYDEEAVDEDEVSDMEDSEDKKSRRWSKSKGMGMSMSGVPGWRGTKKLLGMKKEEKEEVYSAGAPLKKSVSTGTSPFKTSSEAERRRTMQGSLSSSYSSSRLEAAASPGHRRNSSLEPTVSSSFGSSPAPVKMLNGRVYGGRRASEAAERQAEIRAKNEPAFVEWGNSTTGGLGSVAPAKSNSLLADDDDGSGMEWVKRRREERRKQQQADALAKANGTSDNESRDGLTSGNSSVSHSPISPAGTHLVTPHSPVAPLPQTPVIHVSEPGAPPIELTPVTSAPGKVEEVPREHITQAIQMPGRNKEGRDVFDDGVGSDDGDDEDDDDEEEDSSDGDFDDDDDEEEDNKRTTCTAAGVEVISRHKD